MDGIMELFTNLESNHPQTAEEARTRLHELLNSTKEAWVLNGIFDYYLNTGSNRAVDVMVGVREPHERHLFDKIHESLKSPYKLQALTLLGHVVRRYPSWLYKIMNHSLMKELLKLLKFEKDILSLMSALLIVIILLPIIAGLISPYLQDLFEIFSHLASWNTNNPNKVPESQLLHLQVGLYALFNRLYGMYPCNFLNYLRIQYSSRENQPVFTHTIKPMLDTVKMHPLLVTASKDSEVSQARWKKMEANDVIMECAKFSVDTNSERCRDDFCSFRARTASFRKPHLDFSLSSKSDSTDKLPVVGTYSANISNRDIWSPTVYTGPTTPPEVASITHTPITQNFALSTASSYSATQEGNSPPEAAIEATPESTPVKDLSHSDYRRPSSSVARSLSSLNALSQPSSPMKKESSPFKFPASGQDGVGSAFQPSSRSRDNPIVHKIQRMQQEQRNHGYDDDSVKAKVGVTAHGYIPPGSPLRLITPSPLDRSSHSSPHHPDRSDEDREVEKTMRTTQTKSTTPTLKRVDSTREDEPDDLDECPSGSERQGCLDGGLHMPDQKMMAQFARRVNRLRYHSQCQPDSIQLAQIGVSSGSSPRDGAHILDTKVRRAVSCPEMKKDAVVMSDLGNTILNETEEEDETVETQQEAETVPVVSSFTQTDDLPPLIYEHLFLSVFPPWDQMQSHSAPPDVTNAPSFHEPIFSPRSALESYIAATLRSLNDRKSRSEPSDIKTLKEQLELVMHQLQFERHRREVHAERNRRLLGKSRANRALEEHNLALRDQVTLMQKEIETLHLDLDKNKVEAKLNFEQMQQNMDYWKEQCNTMQRKHKEAEIQITLLEKELEEEKKAHGVVAKKLALAQSQMFDKEKSLQDAIIAASSTEDLKNEIAVLQHHLTAAGELETRFRSTLNTLNLHCHKDMESILNGRAFTFSLSSLKAELKNRTVAYSASKCKLNELEAALKKQVELNSEKENLIASIQREDGEKLKTVEMALAELRTLLIEKDEENLTLQSQVEDLSVKCRKLSESKEKEPARKPPQVFASGNSSTLNIAGDVKVHNLQLLVDGSQCGPSKENTSL